MMIQDRGFLGDVENFCKEHTTLSVLTLGFAVVCYAIGNLAGRAVSWIQEALGTTQKTDVVVKEVLNKTRSSDAHPKIPASYVSPKQALLEKQKEIEKNLTSLFINPNLPSVTYNSEAEIINQGGEILTESVNPQLDYFTGIAAMPLPRKQPGYYLHISTGGKTEHFTEEQIEKLMTESIEQLAILGARVQIVCLGADPVNYSQETIRNFEKWQAKHKQS